VGGNFPSDYTPSFDISLWKRFDVRFMKKFIIAKVDSKWGFWKTQQEEE